MTILEALHSTALDRIFHDEPEAVVTLFRSFAAGRTVDFVRVRDGRPLAFGDLWIDDLLATDWHVRIERPSRAASRGKEASNG